MALQLKIINFINPLMNIFKTLLLTIIAVSSAFITLEPTKSQEKIEVTPLIQSTKGLSGKKSHIQDGSKLN